MKIDWNKRYTTIAVYSLIVAMISIVFYLIASEVSLFKIQVGKYINTLQPIIIGFVMAYLFNFILEFYEDRLLEGFFKKEKNKKLRRIIGIVFTYATVTILLYLFLNFILPQLVSSIGGLVNDIPGYIGDISRNITELGIKLDIPEEYYSMVMEKWNEFVKYIITFATDLIPKLGNFAKEGDAVHDGRHAELADTVEQVIAGGIVGAHRLAPFPPGVVGAGEIGRAAEQLGQVRADHVERVLRGLAGSDGGRLLVAEIDQNRCIKLYETNRCFLSRYCDSL